MDEDVSIVIPVHGHAKFLIDALDSVESQKTAINFLIYIVLDRPSKSTLNYVNTKLTNPLYSVIQSSGVGLVSALNSGIKSSKGRYIARFDSDDLMDENRIQKQFSFLEANLDVVLLGSNFIQIDSLGQKIVERRMALRDSDIRRIMYKRSPFAHPSVMIRSSALQLLSGPYNEKYLRAEDHDLWLRLSNLGQLANLDEVLIYYRKHEEQYSFSQGISEALYSRFAVLSHKQFAVGKISVDQKFESLESWVQSPRGRLEQVKLIASFRLRGIASKIRSLLLSSRALNFNL